MKYSIRNPRRRYRRHPTELGWRRFATHVSTGVQVQRQYCGWTQDELAERARLSRGQVAHLEQGRSVDLRVLWAVARAFGLRVGALLP